jgi:pantothenate kinase
MNNTTAGEEKSRRHPGRLPAAAAPEHVSADMNGLSRRVSALASTRTRVLVGIAGSPGAGKSTVAELVAATVVGSVIVPMDGFHLSNRLLREAGSAGRKGAIDTFDLGGYRALLERLRSVDGDTVYAPTFNRDLEEAIAGAIAVPVAARVIITEGNYLLADHPQMRLARPLFDEVWYLDIDDRRRKTQLIERHIRYGRDPVQARLWANGSDEENARLVRASRSRADVIVHLS